MILSCPTCLRRIRREDGTTTVLQEGGARRFSGDPTFAAWLVWARSLRGELGPVAGPCEGCGQPWVIEAGGAEEGAASWQFTTPRGVVEAGPSGLHGPGGPMTVDQADQFLRSQLHRSAWVEYTDPRALFLLGPIIIFTVMAAGWVLAASYVINFVLAAGIQGDLSMPMGR